MCLFVCAVDHGVNKGEPTDEQYYEQVNEDQFCDPEPEGQYLDQDFSEGFENVHALSQFYKHNLLACFTKLHTF